MIRKKGIHNLKKSIIILLVVLAVLIIIIGTVMFLKTNKAASSENSLTDDSSVPFSQIIVCKTAESLKDKAKEYNVSVENDGDSIYVVGASGWGYGFNINGVGNIDGNFTSVESYCFLAKQDEEIDPGTLHEIVETIVPGFIEMFGVTDLKGGYYICDNNGNPLDINATASYDTVLNGEATVKTSIKESKESYWELTISSSGPKGPICSIVHFINDSDFASVSGIININ